MGLDTGLNRKIHLHVFALKISLHVSHIEIIINLIRTETFLSVLVEDNTFDWHVSSNVGIQFGLDRGFVGPSLVNLGTSEYTQGIIWWQGWEAELMLILLDNCLGSSSHDHVELDLIAHCNVVKDDLVLAFHGDELIG